MLGDGGDGERALAGHDPSGEIGSITAKVDDGAVPCGKSGRDGILWKEEMALSGAASGQKGLSGDRRVRNLKW